VLLAFAVLSATLLDLSLEVHLRLAQYHARIVTAPASQDQQISHKVDDIALSDVCTFHRVAPAPLSRMLFQVGVEGLPRELSSHGFRRHGILPGHPAFEKACAGKALRVLHL